MAEKKFEEAMKRLEGIVEDLEGGELPLEESLKSFEEGMKLLTFCSNKLDEVEKRVAVLVKDSEGRYAKKPFDAEEQEES
ncbi:MAG: exodeoxyribonuclease VII small subunit [Deltaproteobacteria bacterium]|nr:exodeoxyribonuclease VII small subunit [Deltaproteobacteria bacterium]